MCFSTESHLCAVQLSLAFGTMAYPLRSEVVRLYKLLYFGWEYPKGAGYFRDRLKSAFSNNKDVKDPEMIKQMIARG
uniref:Complex 1 LYR protein domain-containing protein n=1 Tax=Oncorhynchus mykiss TaxID=8022 RepID=A0A8C7TND8_ONCMY